MHDFTITRTKNKSFNKVNGNTVDIALVVKNVKVVVSANTLNNAQLVKIVEVVAFANTKEYAHDVKNVQEVVFANTIKHDHNVKNVKVVVFANTVDIAHDVKNVKVVAFANTVDIAQYVKNVKVVVSANTRKHDQNVKNVEVVAFGNTVEFAQYVKIVKVVVFANTKEYVYNVKNALIFLVTWFFLQRKTMNRIFRNTNIEKTNVSISYLGCSPQYFKEYIDKKMTPEMSWQNIHLDHIKPVSKFNLQNHDEFLDCCHYSNFQPLLVDNLEKSVILQVTRLGSILPA
jgi:hypothetical protein